VVLVDAQRQIKLPTTNLARHRPVDDKSTADTPTRTTQTMMERVSTEDLKSPLGPMPLQASSTGTWKTINAQVAMTTADEVEIETTVATAAETKREHFGGLKGG
jgi:hypothetical protein